MNKKWGWKGVRFKSNKGGSTDHRSFNIKHESIYSNPDYTLEILQEYEITEQGLLLCAKLKPRQSSLPEFWFRWDARKEELDIDMYGDTNSKEDWINERHGYKGHHTRKLNNGKRNFKILIETPKSKIFEGVISFNLEIDLEVNNDVVLGNRPKIE